MTDIKCRHFLRTQLQWRLPGSGESLGVATEGLGVC
jgi:hypothetical protein